VTPDLNTSPLLPGVKILDFTRVLAGPYATALLADIGADVIKIEPPQGDDYRHVGPFYADGSSALFEAINRGKRSIVADLANDADRRAIQQLAASADVVVENFRPGVAARLGIDYASLSAANPGLIYCSISGFGQSGEAARRPAYDVIVQAMSGIMSVTGAPDGPATLVGEAIADVASGLFASWAILAALNARHTTGLSRYIDVAMLDAMLALQPVMVARTHATGQAPQRVGNRHALSAPFGSFRAADGDVVIAVLNNKLFAALTEAIDQPALTSDPRFQTDALRLQHEADLRRAIEHWLQQRPAQDAVAHLVVAGIPAAQVRDVQQALADTAGRDLTQTVTHPTLGEIAVPQQPVHFSDAPRAIVAAAPALGADNALLQRSSEAIWKTP